MAKKLKGVAVGAGYFSHFHYEAWQRISEVAMVGICDLVKQNATIISQKYGIDRVYDDVEEMLEKEQPDFIDIITPPETHLRLCELAAKHKVHIICQKPITPDYEEAKILEKTIKTSEVRCMVHENFRFQPWYREIHRLLKYHPITGQLHTINFRMRTGDGWQKDAYLNRQPYFREMKRLLIYETGIHYIDVFRYLGGEIAKVYARLRRLNSNIKGEDFGWVHFDFAHGGLGFLDASRYHENSSNDPRFTFGTLLLETDKGAIRLYDDGRLTLKLLGEKEQTHHYTISRRGFAGDCVYNTQCHFVEQFISGGVFETDIKDYLCNVVIQDKVYESHKAGTPIDII